MEICQNPHCLIVDAGLLFLPSLKLCLRTEPMNPVDCSICVSIDHMFSHKWSLTLIHPCSILLYRHPEAPYPWKLLVPLSNLCFPKDRGIDTEICRQRG